LNQFGREIALASSFGCEDVVLIDMLWRLDAKCRVFTLDTGRLHEATYEVMERIRERYAIPIEVYFPDRSAVERLELEEGFYSFRRSIEARKQCCNIRKVEPLNRVLGGLKAWITGLRREQSLTRTLIHKVELDCSPGSIVKLNPLADWGEKQVWEYIRSNQVPYNSLHDQGFPSIGCAPCTRAIRSGEDVRAGRWWWENPETKECGLHKDLSGKGNIDGGGI
jgi:phosphoadenosine phosphosulfate reductase